MIHQVLSYVSAIAGIVSAVFWWRASTILVRRGHPKADGNTFVGDVAVQATFKEQSKFNAWAAWATAIAAAAGGLSQIFL